MDEVKVDGMTNTLRNFLAIVVSMLLLCFAALFSSCEVAEASTGSDLVSVAKSQVGNSGSKYQTYFNAPSSYAWCHMFVSWCAAQIGEEGSAVPHTMSCASGVNWYKSKGLWHDASSSYAPHAGDVVYFYTNKSNSDGLSHHVGIVTYASNGRVHTIEGNARNQVKVDGGYSNGYPQNGSPVSGSTRIIGYGTPWNNAPDDSFVFAVDSPSGNPTVGGNLVAYGWAREGYKAPKRVVYQVNGPGTAEHDAMLYSRGDVPAGCAWRVEIPASEFHSGSNHVSFAADFDDGRHFMETRNFFYKPSDSESPVISNVKVDNITPDGYRITCKVTDNIGVTKVEFPTWTSAGGQDDITWWEGSKSGDTYTFYVKVSDHGNQSGAYNTHIYAYDAQGNTRSVSAAAGLLVPKAMANLGSSTYFLMDDTGMTWKQAKQQCEWAYGGGYLVSIGSKEEQDAVNRLVVSGGCKFYWIGASDAESEGVWKWVSGGAVADTYENWAYDEPSGGTKENYALLRKSDLRWVDDPGNGGSDYGYIMEVEDFHGHNGSVTTDLPEGVYSIHASQNTNYVFDVAGNSTQSGANLQLWTEVGGNNQRYRFTLNDDGTYTITALHSGKPLDVAGASLNEDANVAQYEANQTVAQRFYLEINDDGLYSLRSKANNLYLDICGNAMSNGTNIQTHAANASAAQKFSIRRADDPKVTKAELVSLTSEGYKVRVELDAPRGIQSVKFPSWPVSKGSSVALWETAPVVNNTAEYEVKISDYGSYRGVYCTDVYVTDSFGYSKCVQSFSHIVVPTAVASWSDSTYFLVDDPISVSYAKRIASSQKWMKCTSSHLVAIESQEEQAAIDELLSQGGRTCYWIGASDAESEGSWMWDTGKAVEYTNWASGEPGSNTAENFAAVDRDTGKWHGHDEADSSTWGFIVEYEGDDRAGPTVSDVLVSSIDETGYTLQFKALDPSGVDAVKLAAWNEANGSDDAVVCEPINSYGDDFVFRVDTADHDSKGGTYRSRVIAADSLGNESVIDLSEIGKVIVPDAAVDTGYAVYYRFDQPMTWTEANAFSESSLVEGMQLASVLNESDDDYIASLLVGSGKSAYWIGLSRASSVDSFAWADDSALEYSHWAAGQPSANSSARYVAILTANQKWYAYADAGAGGDVSNMGFIAKLVYPSDEEDSCAGEHAWLEWETYAEATCSSAGLEGRYCERCGELDTRETARLPHAAAPPVVENERAATCAAAGGYDEVVYCSACGAEMSRQAKERPKLEHLWGEGVVTAQPSCESAGARAFACSACNEVKTEEIPASGHRPGEVEVENARSSDTCTSGGSFDEVVYCSACGKELSRERKTAPAGEHTIAYDLAVAPTCTDAGLTAGAHCIVCGEVLVAQRTVAALGHDAEATPAVAPTCTAPGVAAGERCARCGLGLSGAGAVPALGHAYESAVVPPTCTEAGRTEHTCARCGDCYADAAVPATGHAAGEPVRENVLTATCVQNGSHDSVVYCMHCGVELERNTVVDSAHGHLWGSEEMLVTPTCTLPGARAYTCSLCAQKEAEVIPAIGHTYSSTVRENETDATCLAAGGYDEVTRCDICSAELSRARVEAGALGHDYEVSRIIAPTWSEDGYTLRTCKRCGDEARTDPVESLSKQANQGGSSDGGESTSSVVVHQLYNASNEAYRYVAEGSRLDVLVSEGWADDGVAWREPAFTSNPVYELHNVNDDGYRGRYHYTHSALERDKLVEMGWVSDGVAWYDAGSEGLPVYRLYSYSAPDSHYYTTSEATRDAMVAAGWLDEGVAWRASAAGSVAATPLGRASAIDLSGAAVELPRSSYAYAGRDVTPAVTVRLGGEVVPADGYDVGYSSNGRPGAATVTVTGRGAYTGSASAGFTIYRVDEGGSDEARAAVSADYSGLEAELAPGETGLRLDVAVLGPGEASALASAQRADGAADFRVFDVALSAVGPSGEATRSLDGEGANAFGAIGLTFDVGAAYGGYMATVRQVHGSQVIDRGSSVVPADGKVTVSGVDRLSEFAISLQEQYTVSFDAAGGSACQPRTVVAGSSVVLPATTRAGQAFAGWYDGQAKAGDAGASYAPAADVTLVAHWAAADSSASTTPAVAKVAMHRLYNPYSGEHFYTAGDGERDQLKALGWSDEGEGWTAPATSATPVFRLYNAYAGDHHYTTSASERDALKAAGWSYEGVGWYSDDSKAVPLFRQYNPYATTGSHNYTTSQAENDQLVALGWRAEGVGWYGV